MISIIIPAHNERSVIARTLEAITHRSQPGELEVLVVCNGCTDDTATVARHFGPPVRVLETDVANKSQALNLGDESARSFPRVYIDADVVITIEAIRYLVNRLEKGDVLAVAPTPTFDFTGCSFPVRACFDIRSRLPSARQGIGGSGVYALSERGRARFDKFPMVTADDGYVRIQFCTKERETLPSVHSVVFPARTVRCLISQKARAHYGSMELMAMFPRLWLPNRGEANYKSVVKLFKDPRLWLKLAIYCFVTVMAKRRAKVLFLNNNPTWQRDNTSRNIA